MKNRFCRMGKTMIGAFLLLSVGGITYSCQDDYNLPKERPSFLGGSIYDELKAGKDGKTFNYTIRLIDDLGYTEVMSKTGSKTLFVASDEAFEDFFKTNTWGVRSYEQLSAAQKRILFNGAQLNNSYVIEMMGNADNGDKNLALRQNSAAAVVDSVRLWKPEELPTNYSKVEGEKHYWDRFKTGDKRKSILMATDDSEPMMTHFIENNMKEQRITRGDVAFIVGDKNGWNDSEASRAYVFGNRVVKQDIVCLNGYIHVLDKVLVPPGSMAEEIRTNGETNLFSHILDRFSAPFYDATLTENYKALYDANVDSVFEKRYFAMNTKSGRLITGPDRIANNEFPLLAFDPGWNSYKPEGSTEKEKDMGVMYVPSDKALADYFLRGAGRVLLERYAVDLNLEFNEANLPQLVDQIPLDIVQPLVNNLMKPSFNESVPSKYLTIMNDARDPMFPLRDYGDEAAYKATIDKTVLANNGVVYVMNRVISPADYASVLAPALYSSNTQVMRTVVRADDSFVQGRDYAKAPLQQYFSTYLKAMQSRFSFFVPTDDGLKQYGYFDPASITRSRQNYVRWELTNSKGAAANVKVLPIRQLGYRFNMNTGPRPNDAEERNLHNEGHVTIDQGSGYIKKKLLIEMVNHHIVVHDNNDVNGFNTGRKYFLSREGAPVIVTSTGERGKGTTLMGGLAKQFEGTGAAYHSTITMDYNQTREKNGYGNGMTYFIDRPLQATTNSAYRVLKGNTDYSDFVNLCDGLTTEVLDKAGMYDSLKAKKLDDAAGKEREKVALKYYIFVAGNKAGNIFNAVNYGGLSDKLVRFFNNYRYTIYAPTNAAIQAEVAKGLPTWEKIDKYLTDNLQTEVKLADDKSNQKEVDAVNKHNSEVKIKAQAMITTLVNFLKYHFQDESVFVDNVSVPATEYSTSSVNSESKVYMKLQVTQSPEQMSLKDESGQTVQVVAPYNQLVRDCNYNRETAPNYINSSSYAVVHTVGKALLFDKSLSAGYARKWSTVKQAKAFLSKYSIKE